MRAAGVVAFVFLALSLPAGAGAAAPAHGGAGWTTWGNSPLRQSRASSSALTTASAKKLKLAWSRPLGGTGAAQPLYLTRIASGGKRRDIYVTASESGRVSAFDARTGKALWTRELGSVNTGCLQMPKGIFGVTGTPVYDPAGGYIYVAATASLWALDVHTGSAPQRLADRAPDRPVPRARVGRDHARQRACLLRVSRRIATAGPTAGGCSRCPPPRARSTTPGRP